MPRDIALLINPAAGRGRAERTAAIARPRLTEAGFGVRTLQGRDAAEAADLVRAALQDGVEALVVVGGDGLVHLAVQLLAHTETPLGIIPAGTGNDAARALRLPRRDPQKAADVVVAGQVRTVDLARAGSAYVLCVVSAGIDAVVNERANRMRLPRGRSRYALATLAELRGLRARTYDLTLDGEHRQVEALLVAVANGPSFGGGLRIAEGAQLDDGLLDVVLFHPVSRSELVRTYPRLYAGTHTTHPAYELHRTREVTVAGPEVVAYADGERIGPLPLTVRSEPAALRVLTARGEAVA